MNNSTYCPTMKIRVNIFTMFSPVKHITWINYLHCEHFWCEAKSFHNSMQYLAAILIWKSIPRHAISNSGKRTFFTKHFCDVVKIPNVGENLDGTELHWPTGWNSRQHRILINLHSSMSFYVCTVADVRKWSTTVCNSSRKIGLLQSWWHFLSFVKYKGLQH